MNNVKVLLFVILISNRLVEIFFLIEKLHVYSFFQGFQVLVEREWLEFGHKFADRCGNGVNSEDPNERSPVFLQWLDCVYQLFKQFPCAFQFNEAYLVIECQFHCNQYTLPMNLADNIFFCYKVYMFNV